MSDQIKRDIQTLLSNLDTDSNVAQFLQRAATLIPFGGVVSMKVGDARASEIRLETSDAKKLFGYILNGYISRVRGTVEREVRAETGAIAATMKDALAGLKLTPIRQATLDSFFTLAASMTMVDLNPKLAGMWTGTKDVVTASYNTSLQAFYVSLINASIFRNPKSVRYPFYMKSDVLALLLTTLTGRLADTADVNVIITNPRGITSTASKKSISYEKFPGHFRSLLSPSIMRYAANVAARDDLKTATGGILNLGQITEGTSYMEGTDFRVLVGYKATWNIISLSVTADPIVSATSTGERKTISVDNVSAGVAHALDGLVSFGRKMSAKDIRDKSTRFSNLRNIGSYPDKSTGVEASIARSSYNMTRLFAGTTSPTSANISRAMKPLRENVALPDASRFQILGLGYILGRFSVAHMMNSVLNTIKGLSMKKTSKDDATLIPPSVSPSTIFSTLIDFNSFAILPGNRFSPLLTGSSAVLRVTFPGKDGSVGPRPGAAEYGRVAIERLATFSRKNGVSFNPAYVRGFSQLTGFATNQLMNSKFFDRTAPIPLTTVTDPKVIANGDQAATGDQTAQTLSALGA